MWVFLNNQFVPREEARISVFDHGFLYGDGVYETLRSYHGHVFMRQKHIARLFRSARMIGLTIPIPEDAWPELLQETLARNGLGSASAPPDSAPSDGYLRITISRGPGDIGLDPALCPTPTILILAKPLSPYPPHVFEQGVHLSIVSIRRNSASALPPQIKSLNFLNNILAKHEATQRGGFDGVMLNAGGYLAECTASNIFFMRQGRLCTPSLDCGILDGITRGVIIHLAQDHGIHVEEGSYKPADLRGADECFVTNTSMEVMPVTTIDHAPLGSGIPGPLTGILRGLFHQHLSQTLTP